MSKTLITARANILIHAPEGLYIYVRELYFPISVEIKLPSVQIAPLFFCCLINWINGLTRWIRWFVSWVPMIWS